MKTKKLFLMATMLLMSVCSFAQNSNTPLKGDVNGDGKVDVADIVAILKIMKDAGVTQYTVTYHSNGGNSTPATQTVNAGETVTLAGAISRNADSSYTYEFSHWNTNSSDTGTSYNAGQTITINNNIDLYAQWNKTAITPVTTNYYLYVGTTKPTSLSQAQIVTSYPAEQTFVNPSMTEKNYVYVLTNSNKTVNFYDPSFPGQATTKIEDSISISGYKITSTSVKLAKGGEVIIKIS